MNRWLQFCVVCVLLLPAVAVEVTVQEASHDEGNTSIKFTATHGERYRIVVFAARAAIRFPQNKPAFFCVYPDVVRMQPTTRTKGMSR